ncbi:hypothetical protein, conserved [Plasmodium gonderi]|uniref:Mediator of RNA polymerase II transcription subunit 10 n=1 Tax=Plasmodium gonderi TaxID=77519 RepID=A0A1Y1J8S5_PLAGO|nr:hypothetical protein, conserved [Plasmodium gonderi]GAW78911.1 hypothetical protein, conserved [Plasmodium gonderi]
MSENKGRIMLKIHLGNDDENKKQLAQNEKNKVINLKDSKRWKEYSKNNTDGREEHDEFCNNGREKRDVENYKIHKKRIREDRLEEKITSIISKLTKIACICEDQNNYISDNNNSITNSKENSKGDSHTHSRTHSRTRSNDNSLEYSQGCSAEQSGENNREKKNSRICRKLTKEMYKYEKCLISLNNFINDKNNKLDEITFPNGLVKAVDNYISPDVWIYKYLLLECKKQSDKYRNLIQNIATFDSTLRSKIINEHVDKITMPIYPPLAHTKLDGLPSPGEKNYYKNVHIPKELADAYFENLKRRKTDQGEGGGKDA